MSLLVAAAGLVLAGALALAGAAKLASPGSPQAGRDRWYDWTPSGAAARALGALELLIAAGVLARWRPAAVLAAALLWAFAAWMAIAVARGRSGAPCACFGGRSRIGRGAALRTVTLAAAATLVAAAPSPRLSTTGWLGLLVALLACGCALLAAIAIVLAREVAVLRARSAPPGALEVADEGPPVGDESPLIESFPALAGNVLAVAVFVSPGCRLCRELEPAVAALAAHPAAAVVVFDEERDPLAWEAAGVPGSPYAVALSPAGVVLAKGTFNTRDQLESVPATAVRRLREGELARA